ncbi:hypothetical protein T12_13882 [Trichinella patagoniensis]|uniref:Uncharacterized protein n=1 Tax=Trichinella patagoniensis TaxID=990121 RepID=A0A0V0Z8G3_9BILA|nr:hypothetical protein T12_13882 [Trichinella patagoniensis]
MQNAFEIASKQPFNNAVKAFSYHEGVEMTFFEIVCIGTPFPQLLLASAKEAGQTQTVGLR